MYPERKQNMLIKESSRAFTTVLKSYGCSDSFSQKPQNFETTRLLIAFRALIDKIDQQHQFSCKHSRTS